MADEKETGPAPAGDASRSDPELSIAVNQKAGTKEQNSDVDKNGTLENTRDIKGLHWVVVVVAILLSTFLYALDNTIVANIRPSIIASLGQIQKLPWVSVAYAVGEVGSNPFWYVPPALFNDCWNPKRPSQGFQLQPLRP